MKRIAGLLSLAVILCVANLLVSNHHIFADAPKELPADYSEITAQKLYDQWISTVEEQKDKAELTLSYTDDEQIRYLPFEVFSKAGSTYLADLNKILEMAIPFSGFHTSYSLKYSLVGTKKICFGIETKLKLNNFNEYIAIQPKVNEITAGIMSAGSTDRERITLLNQYLIENVKYDETFGVNLKDGDMRVWESWGALNDGVAVCSGYVNAFAQICQAMDIPVVSVVGYRDRKDPNDPKEIGHEWNEVYIEGKWYAVDVTSNDPVIVGGTMEDGEKNVKYGSDFLLVDQSFLIDRKYEWDEKKLTAAKKMVYPYLTIEENI